MRGSGRGAWVAAAWLVLAPRGADACVCMWWGKPDAEALREKAMAEAPVILVGTVLEAGSSIDRPKEASVFFKVKVTSARKGNLTEGEVIEVSSGHTTCGVMLVPGVEYQVHTAEDLSTSVCMGLRSMTPEPTLPPVSAECEKRIKGSPREALPAYDEVFEGKLTSWRSTEPGKREVHLTVERVWKGRTRTGEPVTVMAERNGPTVPGVEHMLVFSRRAAGGLVADVCSPSRSFVRDEDAHLEELGPPPSPAALAVGSRCGACAVGRAGEEGPGVAGLGLGLGGLAWHVRRSRRRGRTPAGRFIAPR